MSSELLQDRNLRVTVPELMVSDPIRRKEIKEVSRELPSYYLTDRQQSDLELLMNGAFSPLNGFMGSKDYIKVCREMRLLDGTVWPVPVTLDVNRDFADQLETGSKIALRHPEGVVMAVMTVDEAYVPDKLYEADMIYGTGDDQHPGVFQLINHTGHVYLGGKVEGLEYPPHHTFTDIRKTPNQMRKDFKDRGWDRIVAFQTRNPMHNAHISLTKKAMDQYDAALLIHPVVGPTKPGDIDPFVRVRAYEKIIDEYPDDRVALSVLPLAMRMAGPREALWHAIIRKNYGATHFIIGRDHAGVINGNNNEPFYDPFDAQHLTQQYEEEIGIKTVVFDEMVYVEEIADYMPRSGVREGDTVLGLSGSELRRRLRAGEEIPSWFTPPDVAKLLEKAYPPREKQGITVFLTGLSGSGKSTIARALDKKLTEIHFENGGDRMVTNLDGDIVRNTLSKGLGFSEEDRRENVRRVGWVASEITRHGGVAVCALIAPNKHVRREVREMVEQSGGFIEVYVNTPLGVCEERDVKGLYAKARSGQIKNFTGIDDPYDVPEDAEVVINTDDTSAEQAAVKIIKHLVQGGYLTIPETYRLEEEDN